MIQGLGTASAGSETSGVASIPPIFLDLLRNSLGRAEVICSRGDLCVALS
jgi:hypothetical protein